ncbi:MAG: hypothetical protein FJ279_07210 [Planctomycetes bacterium]|nr:hypothetical protein [Planctomycetota bacterium]
MARDWWSAIRQVRVRRLVSGAAGRLALLGLLSAAAWAEQGVRVVWHSQPVAPGQTVMLYGEGLANAGLSVTRLDDAEPGEPPTRPTPLPPGAAVEAIQPSAHSVKFVLPASLKPGVFAARVRSADGEDAALVNAPNVFWAQGDLGLEASPGGWVRAFGTCLAWQGIGKPLAGAPPGSPATTILLTGPKKLRLNAQADCYSAQAALPADAPEGTYQLSVHNGCGGPAAWSQPQPIVVRKPEAWLQNVVSVKRHGVTGDGVTDDTVGVQAAIDAVAGGGGGVLFFPNGRYKLSSALKVPPKVFLRGESQDGTQLFWTNHEFHRLECVLLGSHHFGLEDMTLWFVGAENGILTTTSTIWHDKRRWDRTKESAADGPPQGHITLRRVRMRWLLYYGLPEVAEDVRLYQQMNVGDGIGARGDLLKLSGPNIRLIGCDLYSSGRLMQLDAADGAIVTGNTCSIGRQGYVSLQSGRKHLWENNRFTGADNQTRALVFLEGMPYVESLYFGRNDLAHANYADAETFSTDGASAQHFGRVASATPTRLTLVEPVKWNTTRFKDGPRDHLLFVLDGKGRGQFRRVVEATGNTVTVEPPLRVAPDATSVVGVNHNVCDWVVVGNRFADSTCVQMYGIGFNILFAENLLERLSYGLALFGTVHAKEVPEPNFFIQVLANRLTPPRFDPRVYARRVVESGVGLWNFYPRGEKFPHPFTVGCVVRGNELSGGMIELATSAKEPHGTSIEDVIIEDNAVADSRYGIALGERTSGVCMRGNRFRNVVQPLRGVITLAENYQQKPSDYAVSVKQWPPGPSELWLHPAEVFLARLEAVRTGLRQSGQALPDDLERLESAARPLLSRPCQAPEVEQACRGLLDKLWAALAAHTGGYPVSLLEGLIGLRLGLDENKSSLSYFLARSTGGAGDVLFIASLPEGMDAVTLTLKPDWPQGWEPATPALMAEVKPGQDTELRTKVKVPAGSWGRYGLPVQVEVSRAGQTVKARLEGAVGLCSLGEWMVIGPFARQGDAAQDVTRHPPESRLDLKAEYDGLAGKIRWEPLTTDQRLEKLPALPGVKSGTVYALACVQATEDMLASVVASQIREGCQVWVNGEELPERKIWTARSATVRLRAGENFVLLKLTTHDGVWTMGVVRVQDLSPRPGGRLRMLTPPQMQSLPGLQPGRKAQLERSGGVDWQPVFQDDFKRTELGPNWEVIGGKWSLSDGKVVGEGSGAFLACKQPLGGGAIRIEADLSAAAPGDIGVFFGPQPGNWREGYLWGLITGRHNRLLRDGATAALSRQPLAELQTSYHLIAQVQPDGLVQLFANNEPALSMRETVPACAEGTAGLYTWGKLVCGSFRIYRAAVSGR